MREESREHWPGWDIMLLVPYRNQGPEKSKLPPGKGPAESGCIENHSPSNVWGFLGVTSNTEANQKSNQVVNNPS